IRAAPRTAPTGSWWRATRTSCTAADSGRAAAPRARSTPTPIPNRTASPTPRYVRTPPPMSPTWASTCCPTRRPAAPTIPTPPYSRSSRAPTRRPPTTVVGTGRHSNSTRTATCCRSDSALTGAERVVARLQRLRRQFHTPPEVCQIRLVHHPCSTHAATAVPRGIDAGPQPATRCFSLRGWVSVCDALGAPAAVDRHHDTRDERCGRGAEEVRELGHLGRLAEPLHRDAGEERVGVEHTAPADPRRPVRGDRPRRAAVRPVAACGPFGRQPPHESAHAGLARAVGRAAGKSDQSVARRHQPQRPAARHPACSLLRTDHRAGEVHAQQRVPVLRGVVEGVTGLGVPGVGD